MDKSESSNGYCEKISNVVLPILFFVWVFIVVCIILTGLYFATVYLGYFYAVINKIDDDTGCQDATVKDYLSQNITNKALWKCPENCSHKSFSTLYGACFFMGLLTWIIVIPLTCGGGLVLVFITVLIWQIIKNYCIFNSPQTIFDLHQVTIKN